LVLACASEVADTSSDNFLGFDSLISYAPSWWYGTIPLSPDRLQIQGQDLVNTGETNTDGSFWGAALVSAPSGMNTEVTPASLDGVKDYTFYEQATNVTLQILDANNGNANLSLQTNTVIVGQQMNFTCQLSVTNAFMTNFPLSNFQWTVPGYAISNYVANGQTGTVYTNFPMNNTNVIFYWVDGASNRTVQCSATVNGQTVTGQAVFNVARPTASITTQLSSISVDGNYTSNHEFALHFGNYPGIPGILFSNDNSKLYAQNYSADGILEWVQIVNFGSNSVQTLDGTWHTLLLVTNGMIDTSYPYDFNNFTTDSPGQAASPSTDYLGITVTNNFTMTLLFIPTAFNGVSYTNSCYIPLASVNWNWGSSATSTSTNWILTSSNSVANPPMNTLIYPQWTDNATNHTFTLY
jgi:hypothetical protein